eukprot:CAMPEP_0196665366 /NCGR_PEP_ID=MMETSP1086-20130531/60723_1 /TAXON_ID=77921 /ORGANISM="Cyanoptyche  gloeocystis , Strain SAG4.97" /LENGTH=85 /DNA_ID=CAMNT_0042002097 /DNA_START=1430 /DNA_END=1684 /DNA_ORIENTATION=+
MNFRESESISCSRVSSYGFGDETKKMKNDYLSDLRASLDDEELAIDVAAFDVLRRLERVLDDGADGHDAASEVFSELGVPHELLV